MFISVHSVTPTERNSCQVSWDMDPRSLIRVTEQPRGTKPHPAFF